MKRTLALFIVIFIIMMNVTAFSILVNAKEKTTLKVFNWGENISNGEDDSMDIIKEFEKKYPDIDVEYTTFATNEEMYAKISSGSASYDICIPSDYMIGKMIEEDMLAKIDFANIENFKYIDDDLRNPAFDPTNEFSVPYTWGTVGIIYNTKVVTETVDSWNILWDEKYTNDIIMIDNPRDAFMIAGKKLGYSMNTTDKSELDKIAEELKKQKPVLKAYLMDEIFNNMSSGDASLAPYYAGDAITMINDNPDLAFAVPKEGTNQFVDSMVILKDTKNKEAAEKFINFCLGPEIMAANISYINYSSPSTTARNLLDDEMKNNIISYPDKAILDNSEFFNTLPKETTEYMQELWIEVKTSDDKSPIVFIIMAAFIACACVGLIILKRKKKNDY